MMRLGVVPYLNALPLYHTLQQHTLQASTQVDVVRAVPSQLAPQLARGECDVALIPIVEHFRGVGESVISDACIGSSQAVRSVLLFHRVPLQEITSVTVDASSRTSVALLRIVLEDGYGITPAFIEHTPDFDTMFDAHDAALLIGDNALEATPRAQESNTAILDLGLAWKRITGLPFVYAAWVTRRGLEPHTQAELATLLNQARDEGTQRIIEIARDATANIPAATIESYLREAIEYSLTPRHRAGMTEFKRRCLAKKLIESH
ncbi:MAG TPA: menaquinone biosynthesis protein [Abditibacteriaceae bacterium]|jgi:chorismate dehydratase